MPTVLYDIDFDRVGGKYRLKNIIGSGASGDVYCGLDILSQKDVAVKIEAIKWEGSQLEHEYEIYLDLLGSPSIPRIHWFGTEGDYDVLVIDLLGPSLQDLFTSCQRKFSLKTSLLLADKMISQIEDIHSHNIVHRDIKPDHFLLVTNKARKDECDFRIVDFGLAKYYMDVETLAHCPYRGSGELVGTARYCSINAHLGVDQTYRDDLESLAYVFIYFLRGSLPWQSFKLTSKKDHRRILEKKQTIPTTVLCQDLPAEFGSFLDYARSLRFGQMPNYVYIRTLFRDLLVREGYCYDSVFDWNASTLQEVEDSNERDNAIMPFSYDPSDCGSELAHQVLEPVYMEKKIPSQELI